MVLKNISKKVIFTLALLGIATPSFANIAKQLEAASDARHNIIRSVAKVEMPEVSECLVALHDREQACNALNVCGWLFKNTVASGSYANLTDAVWQECSGFALSCQQNDRRVVAACSFSVKPSAQDPSINCDLLAEMFSERIRSYVDTIVCAPDRADCGLPPSVYWISSLG